MALKENSRKVFDYVKAHEGEDFTAKDIAAALDLAVQSKLIKLTDAGKAFDPDAEPAE